MKAKTKTSIKSALMYSASLGMVVVFLHHLVVS